MIEVSVINLPTNITVNPEINDIMKTKDLLFSGHHQVSEIDDTDWYYGNVLRIVADCHDCEKEVKVLNHIHEEDTVKLVGGLTEFSWGSNGGSLQVFDMLMHFYHNGTISNVIHFPEMQETFCLMLSNTYSGNYEVSACVNAEGVNLYVTSFVSYKGYAFEPYTSKAEELLKIDSVNEIVMLVDSSKNPFLKFRPGGVILYSLNEDF